MHTACYTELQFLAIVSDIEAYSSILSVEYITSRLSMNLVG
jgi:hypothetical protein